MSYYRTGDSPETSHQGTLRMIQQDLQGHMLGTDEKIGKLQEQIEMLVLGLHKMNVTKNLEEEYEVVGNGDFKENFDPNFTGRGMYRDPLHAAYERQRLRQKEVKSDYGFGESKTHNELHSLKHLKLVFPSFKEGSDTMEWLRDCDEYFTIYEVPDNKRAVIAAMHLNGTPRSWFKSFMIGREKVSWQNFSEAFMARFGAVETDLVFDRFKKLQQVTSVEHYYDEFEKCRGQLLRKIPSLTSEYFLENFIGGLQGEIKGMIRLLEPNTLEQALRLARYYESTLNMSSKRSNSFSTGPKTTQGSEVPYLTRVLQEAC